MEFPGFAQCRGDYLLFLEALRTQPSRLKRKVSRRLLRACTLQSHGVRTGAQAGHDHRGGGGQMRLVLYNPLTAASADRIQQTSELFKRIDISVLVGTAESTR